MSMNKDNSHSWVTISHGSSRLVTNLNNSEQETSVVQSKEYALRLNASGFALLADQRPKQNHEDVLLPAHPQELYPSGRKVDWCWAWRLFASRLLSVRTTEYSSSSWSSTSRRRWSDWILEIKKIKWKSTMAKGGGNKKDFNIVLIHQDKKFFIFSSSRSFMTQSRWSFITGQCFYSEQFLPVHLSCRMCNQYAFHHQFRIGTGRTILAGTDRRCSLQPWILCIRITKIRKSSILTKPRLASHEKKWKRQ